MRSSSARIMLGAVALVAAVALFVVLSGDGGGEANDGDTAGKAIPGGESGDGSTGGKDAKPQIPTVVIRDGEPVGGVAELSYDAGDRIRFAVRSDVSDEIHVHVYDLSKDVKAGGQVAFDFPAEIEGVFEAELEDRGEPILELRVNP